MAAITRHFGVGFEVAWGTPVASTMFFEVLSESIKTERNKIRIKTIRSSSTRKIVDDFTIVRGTVEVVLNYQDIPLLAYFMLGDVDTTGAGPYVHTIPGSTGIEVRPPLTLELQRDSTALTWRYAGCIITSLAIAVTEGQEARATVGFVGKSEATGTATSATYPDLDVVIPSHCTATIDAVTQDATAFNLNINYPVDEPKVLGTTSLGKQPRANDVIEVAGDMTVIFEDLVEYNKMIANDDVDVQLSCDSGGDELLVINMNIAKLLDGTPALSGRERLTTVYPFESTFHTTATENIQFVGTNDDAVIPAP